MLLDKNEALKTLGVPRSPKWPALAKAFLKGKVCAVCGSRKKLQAHHIIPFHVDPSKELDTDNLAPLCEGNPAVNCHLIFGHLGNFRSINKDCRRDASTWSDKIKNRPTLPKR